MPSADLRASLRALLAAPIAHRGLHGGGVASIENSHGAAEAAIRAGYGIECDIQLSRDGQAMVFHDDRLERLTETTGRLADYAAAHLSGLTLGGGPDRIPTLEAFLRAVGGRAPLVIEIKSAGDGNMCLADHALALIRPYEGAVALESFDPVIVAHCRDHGAPCPVGLVGPAQAAPDADIPDECCDFLSWSIDAVTAIAARYPRLPLTTWTVRTKLQQKLATNAGAQIVFEGFTPLIHG